jgi:uncharacterized spore protein YtfJ
MISKQAVAVVTGETTELVEVEPSTIEDYKKLNDKCDAVISKIKNRKKKTKKEN